MTDTDTPIHIDFDDPDKLVRAGDVLRMLETDRDLARAVAEHHQLLRSPDTPIDSVNLARYICFVLTEGEIEQTRRLYGEAAVDCQKITRELTNTDVPLQKRLVDRLRFLSLKTAQESDVGGAGVA